MGQDQFDVIIIGSGLAGSIAAARLLEESERIRIAMITSGSGGTPYIAALNAALPCNPWGDSPDQHAQDMFQAGHFINAPALVKRICREAPRGVEFLQKMGIEFAKKNGEFLRRHTSGSTYPRSLCQISDLLGKQILRKLQHRLHDKGMVIFNKAICNRLLVREGEVYGVSFTPFPGGACQNLYAADVIAAWGGIGNLFPESTYPPDIDGRSLAMAFEAGVSLIDLEFLEFEPLVTVWPEGARGEPCPTAMLGEGAYLLNRNLERFILKVRPQGEAGSPKTLLNQAIWQELAAEQGSPHGGIFVDLRHIPLEILKAYPWFYNRIANAGLDLKKDLLEVRPIAHSHSGGVAVAADYQTNVNGLFAIGEAAGGIHGACRLGGNAATQALVSGFLGAEGVLAKGFKRSIGFPPEPASFLRDIKIYDQVVPEVKKVVGQVLGPQRDRASLEMGKMKLEILSASHETRRDSLASQIILSALLMVQSGLLRKESRGCHYRSDYPATDPDWRCSIEIYRSSNGAIEWRRIPRDLGS